jgi:hypothetical protein
MAYCTAGEVRGFNNAIKKEIDLSDEEIEGRITEAENEIKVDLSSIISEADLDSISSTSKVVYLLAIYKSMELTLIKVFSVQRKVDEISDIDYYRKKYDKLINKILKGDIVLTEETTIQPKDYPARTASNIKLYPGKGIPKFEDEEDYLLDDRITETS